MRIYENGHYRDMTAEEIAEMERIQSELPVPEPTQEERIAILEESVGTILAGERVLLSTLDAAYQEGVNSL